jgi:hypothetical protein
MRCSRTGARNKFPLSPRFGTCSVYRVCVVTAGDAWYEVIDGLRAALKEVGFEEGKQFTLTIRDAKGNLKR